MDYGRFGRFFLMAFFSLSTVSASHAAMSFSNVTVQAGITFVYEWPAVLGQPHFGGAVAEDFDGDGLIDLFCAQGKGNPQLLYMNNGDGTFTNEASARGADLTNQVGGVSAADYDNDGDIDVCLSIPYGNSKVLINDGTGNFTSELSLSQPDDMTMSSSWGDVNNDGLLELAFGQWFSGIQGVHMYRNDGGGVLTEYEFRDTPRLDEKGFAPRFTDLDNDGDADLPVAADFFESQVYLNKGAGTFTNVTAASGVGGPDGGDNDMGFAVGDYDEDGDMDLFITSVYNLHLGKSKDGNRLYQNKGDGTFTNVTFAAGVEDGSWGWGAAFGDLDNDGDLDIYHVNGFLSEPAENKTEWNDKPARLFENRGDGTFTNTAVASGAGDTGQGRGVLLFDYDDDGDLDIFISNNRDRVYDASTNAVDSAGTPTLLRNDTANGNHWLKFKLQGSAPYHSAGIGSRVYVKTGSVAGVKWDLREVNASTHYLSQSPATEVHFGLGGESTATQVKVVWAGGDISKMSNVVADQTVKLPSPSGVLSSRSLNVGDKLGLSIGTLTNPVDWVIGGTIYSNPASVAMTAAGTDVDVVLRVYDGTETFVVREECYLIDVQQVLCFSNVTASAGITNRYNRPLVAGDPHFGGAVSEDFNGDGLMDIFFPQGNGDSCLLYINKGDGTFTNEAAARNADVTVEGSGASAADYDNDGDIDICISIPFGDSMILVNDGAGTFSNSFTVAEPSNMTISSSWGDVDNDGQLELGIGQWVNQAQQGFYLYKNLGGGVLSNYEFRVSAENNARVFAPRFADVDNDGNSDIVLCSDFGWSRVYMNQGDTTFSNNTALSGVGGPDTGGSNDMGHAIGDYDDDGDLDLFITSIHNLARVPASSNLKDGNRLYENQGDGTFTNVEVAAGVEDGNWGWAAAFGDLDNDGDLDIYHVNGWITTDNTFHLYPSNRLFSNAGDGTFVEVAKSAGAADQGQGRGMFLFDYDEDGDLDIFVINNQDIIDNGPGFDFEHGTPVLYRNDSKGSNNWLKAKLQGTPPLHRNGIGSRIYVKTGDVAGVKWKMREVNASSHFLAQSPASVAHFGLGKAGAASQLRVDWVGGSQTLMSNVTANQTLCIPSPVGMVSSENPAVGETVQLFAGTTNKTTWLIDGVVYTNPLNIAFNATDPNTPIILQVWDGSESFVERHEFTFLDVGPEFMLTNMTAVGDAETIAIHCPAGDGDLIQLQWASNLMNSVIWTNFGSVQTGDVSGTVSIVMTNLGEKGFYRIIKVEN